MLVSLKENPHCVSKLTLGITLDPDPESFRSRGVRQRNRLRYLIREDTP